MVANPTSHLAAIQRVWKRIAWLTPGTVTEREAEYDRLTIRLLVLEQEQNDRRRSFIASLPKKESSYDSH